MTRAAILIIVLMVTACTPDVQPELVHTKSVPQCLNGRVFAEWRIGFGLPEANHLDPIVHQLVVDNYNNVEPISSHNPARVYVFGRPAFGDALIFFVNATGMCVELAFPAPLSIVLKWMTPPKPFGVPVSITKEKNNALNFRFSIRFWYIVPPQGAWVLRREEGSST